MIVNPEQIVERIYEEVLDDYETDFAIDRDVFPDYYLEKMRDRILEEFKKEEQDFIRLNYRK